MYILQKLILNTVDIPSKRQNKIALKDTKKNNFFVHAMSKPDIESVDKYFGTQMDTQTTRVVVNLPRVCERKNGKFVCSRVYFKVVV